MAFRPLALWACFLFAPACGSSGDTTPAAAGDTGTVTDSSDAATQPPDAQPEADVAGDAESTPDTNTPDVVPSDTDMPDVDDIVEDTADAVGGSATAIDAAAGGTAASTGGGAKVIIPAGALAQDTTITVEELPAEAGTQSPIFDFGPSGTAFSPAATVCIAWTGAAPEGKEAVAARRDTAAEAFQALETKAGDAADLLCGATDHFSQFTVMFVDGVLAPSQCPGFDGFVACGGALDGTWEIQDVCFGSGGFGPEPPVGCKDTTQQVDVTITGTLTFSAGELTTALTAFTVDSLMTVDLSSCPVAVTCAEFDQELEATCTEAVPGMCACDYPVQSIPTGPPSTTAITVSGMQYVHTDGTINDYCVKDGTLTLRTIDEDGDTYTRATLKP